MSEETAMADMQQALNDVREELEANSLLRPEELELVRRGIDRVEEKMRDYGLLPEEGK